MLFLALEGGKSSLISVDGAIVKRTYTTNPPQAPFGACYCPRYGVVLVPQRQNSLFAFSSEMQQPLRKCFLPETLSATALSPCQNFLFGGGEATGSLYVWSLRSGELLRIVKAHMRKVTCLAASSCGSLIASASEDSSCRVWTVAQLVSQTTRNVAPLRVIAAHTLAVTTCCFLQTLEPAMLVTGSMDRTMRMFDAVRGQQMRCFRFNQPVTLVRPTAHDTGLLVGCRGGDVHFLSLYGGCDTWVGDGAAAPAAYGAEDDSGTDGGVLLRWRPPFADGHSGDICFAQSLLEHPDHMIVASTGGVVLTWNFRTAKVVGQTVPPQKKGIVTACWVGATAPAQVSLTRSVASHPLPRSTTTLPVLAKYPTDLLQVGYTVVGDGLPPPAGVSAPGPSPGVAAVTEQLAESTTASRTNVPASASPGAAAPPISDEPEEAEDAESKAKRAKLEAVLHSVSQLQHLRDQLQVRWEKLQKLSLYLANGGSLRPLRMNGGSLLRPADHVWEDEALVLDNRPGGIPLDFKLRDRYILLHELMEYMGALYTLIRGSSNAENRYYVVVPPNVALQSMVIRSELKSRGGRERIIRRLPQKVVRAHILHGTSDMELFSLTGQRARLEPFEDAEQEVEPRSSSSATANSRQNDRVSQGRGLPLASFMENAPPPRAAETKNVGTACSPQVRRLLRVEVKQGRFLCAQVRHALHSTMAPSTYFTFLLTDRSLLPEQQEEQENSGGVCSNDSKQGSLSGEPHTWNSCSGTHQPATAHLWQRLLPVNESGSEQHEGPRLKSDESTLRALLEDAVVRKQQKHPALATSLREQLDAALMYCDTEVAIMRSSYVCISGFESHVVQKVNRIVENAVDLLLSSLCAQLWTEEEREDILVVFHTIVCGGVASKITEHWDTEWFNDNTAFVHACASLLASGTADQLLPNELCHLTPDRLDAACHVLRLAEQPCLSVISYMRILEAVITEVVAAAASAGVTADLTADLCIPIVATVVLQCKPLTLPSRIEYLGSFGIAVLEMSSLGYAVATFEAAVSVILSTYRNRVLTRE